MKKAALIAVAAQIGLAGAALAQPSPASFSLTVDSIQEGGLIPEKFANCVPDGKGKTQKGGNINPAMHWANAPAGTRSFAVIVVDPDVPASFELANQPGKTIPADLPRRNFYHWALIDIPASLTGLAEGQNGSGIPSGGKPAGKTAYGVNGRNDYPDGGYDGPCPPWNDERMHHYHFSVFALDVPSLELPENFDGKQAEAALKGHILAEAEVIGNFSNNKKSF